MQPGQAYIQSKKINIHFAISRNYYDKILNSQMEMGFRVLGKGCKVVGICEQNYENEN